MKGIRKKSKKGKTNKKPNFLQLSFKIIQTSNRMMGDPSLEDSQGSPIENKILKISTHLRQLKTHINKNQVE
jgi:hypothetical protein